MYLKVNTMERQEAIKIAQHLGLTLELNSEAPKRSQFMRFRHKLAPQTSDFAIVIWCDESEVMNEEDFWANMEVALINVGKYLKVKQFKEIL
jgi:hypothetical protein